ncbi:MAG: methyltransferase domain-containing protein [Deltaproteobacteria bacterium]|nr:methyltransferase domain-containing protein [Deltaproteobacteria bacterium]
MVTTDRGVVAGNTYDKYGTKNPVARALMGGFLRSLGELLPRSPPRRVLEIGAGEGEIGRRLRARYPDASIVAVEYSPRLAADAHRRTGLPYAAQSATQLGLRSSAFDLVVMCEVLEHLTDPEAALGEVARVASGDVVLSVPREPLWRALNVLRGSYLADLGNTPGHVQHWSRSAFVEIVGRHLRVTRVRSPLPWTMVAATRR